MSARERMRHWWDTLLTAGMEFPPGDPLRRRVMLLNLMLLVGSLLILLFAAVDYLITGFYQDAAAEFGGGACFLSAYLYVRRTRNIDTAALVMALLTMALILGDVWVAGTRDVAIYWIALFPLVAFFLLGAVWGLVLTLIFYAIAFAFMLYGMHTWAPVVLNWVAMLNICGTLVGILVFVWYYESSRAKAQRELEEAAQRDALTGLFNRRHFMGQFDLEHDRSVRHGLPLSLLLIDIDSLRMVNDTHGHQAGDAVIQAVAERLLDSLRRTDLVARLGGEEFGVLLPHTNALQAARVAEKLRTAVEESATLTEDKWISVTISIGVAENGASRATFASLFAAADGALYHAKQAGRNRVMAT